MIRENSGFHIVEAMERVDCTKHDAPIGSPCWTVPKNVNGGFGRYAAICGNRIRRAGFRGRISSLSMQSKSALNASVAKRQSKSPRKFISSGRNNK